MAAAAALVLWETRRQGFFADEWYFFVHRQGNSLYNLLAPNNGNLALVPILLYKAVIGLFGPQTAAFRFILVALELLSAALFFELARRRVGDWIALGAATLLLFLGASWLDVSTLGITLFLSTSFGLGALLALDRGDRGGDLAAFGLLCLALASYSAALPFVAGAAVAVFLRGPERRRRDAWVVVVPVVLYGAWRIWANQLDDPLISKTVITLASAGTAPAFVFDAFAAGMASLSGLFRVPGDPLGFSHELGIPLAVLFAVLAGARVWAGRSALFAGRAPLSRDVWVFLVMPPVYWLALALASQQGVGSAANEDLLAPRHPDVYGYQYTSVVLLLLAAAALASGLRRPRAVGIGLAILLPVALIPNLVTLHEAAKLFRGNGELNRAELAAVELAGDRARAVPVETEETTPDQKVRDMTFQAPDYLAASRAHGSAAQPISSLPVADPEARAAADLVLVRLLELAPRQVSRLTGTPPVAPPIAVSANNGSILDSGSCLIARPRNGLVGEFSLRLPPGGVAVESTGGPPIQLALRRFGDGEVPLAPVTGGSTALLRIPRDGSPQPWLASLAAAQQVKVCPPPAP